MNPKKLIQIFLFCFCCAALGQVKPPLHNNDFMAGLMVKAAKDVSGHFSLGSGDTVHCRDMHPVDPVRQYLMTAFYKALLDEGVQVYWIDSDSHHDKMDVTIVLYDLKYGEMLRKQWFRGLHTERHGIVRISTRYRVDGFLKIHEFTEFRQDTLRIAELPAIEKNGLIPNPAKPRDRGIRRWIEPIGFGLAMAGLSYAFYSVRSQ